MIVAIAITNMYSQMNTIQLRNGSNTTTILPSASSTIAVQIPALSAGTHFLLTSTTNPGSSGAAGSFLTYGATSAQNTSDISATNYLFNVGYAATAVEQAALGGLITSTATGTNRNATALTLAATGTGTGTSTALYITNGRLTFTDSDDSHTTSFTTGNQTANINYTLPTADGTSGQVLSTNGSGVLSWSTAASSIDALTDAKSGGTGFTNSLILGHQTTGTLSSAERNTAVGIAAMQAITSGTDNAGLGHNALYAVTGGYQLAAFGSGALQAASTATRSVAIGYQAGYNVTTGEYSVFVGSEAGKAFTTGGSSVGVGFRALYQATGDNNIAVGPNAGYDVSTATHNILIGSEAGYAVTTGSNNVAIGNSVLKEGSPIGPTFSRPGSRNTAIGDKAMQRGGSGSDNVAIGSYSQHMNGDGAKNVTVGNSTAVDITTGSNNVVLGHEAGTDLTSGAGNVLIGYQAGFTLTTQSNQLYIDNSSTATPLIQGDFSANTLTFNGATTTTGNVTVGGGAAASEIRLLEPSGSGSNYTAFKAQAQASNVTYTLPTTAGTNGFVLTTDGSGGLSWAAASGGASAINDLSDAVKDITDFTGSMILGHQTTGTLAAAQYNTAVGMTAMDAITSGDANTVLGYNAATALTSGSWNVVIGSQAGEALTTSDENTLVGQFSGRSITTGMGNTAFGASALINTITGAYNVAVGYSAGGALSASSYSIAVGDNTFANGPGGGTGNYNIAIGSEALFNGTTGANNVMIGYRAGRGTASNSSANNVVVGHGAGAGLTSGSSNVLIGYNAGSALTTQSNQLYISNSNDATPLIQGNFSTDALTFNGSTTTTGNVTVSGTTTYTAPAASKTVTATTSTGAGAPDIASFTNTYEKVTVTADGAAAGFVQLPTGTEGQIVYVRFLFSGSQTVTIVNSNTAATNTAMVFDGSGADVIVAHMLYTGTAEGWVVFSALEYDN